MDGEHYVRCTFANIFCGHIQSTLSLWGVFYSSSGLGFKTRSTDNISQQQRALIIFLATQLGTILTNAGLHCHCHCQHSRRVLEEWDKQKGSKEERQRNDTAICTSNINCNNSARTLWQIHPRDGCVWGQSATLLIYNTTTTTTTTIGYSIASFIHTSIHSSPKHFVGNDTLNSHAHTSQYPQEDKRTGGVGNHFQVARNMTSHTNLAIFTHLSEIYRFGIIITSAQGYSR